jgi:hypothetical protein
MNASPTRTRMGGAGFDGCTALPLRCRKRLQPRCFSLRGGGASGMNASPTEDPNGWREFRWLYRVAASL